MNSIINLQSTVKRSDSLLSTELDDETVLMSIENGTYYGMEQTARRIWILLESPQRVAVMIDQLAQEYQVAPEICGPDILHYLQELCDEGLVTVS